MRQIDVDRAFERFRQTRDPGALAEVFDATAQELYRLAFYLTGDPHAAEDILQTTFLTVLQDVASHQPGRPVTPWLCGILTNRALAHRRRARRHRAAAQAAAAGTGAAGAGAAQLVAAVLGTDPADAAAAAETRREIGRCVRRLAEPYRRVLILHLEHGLTGAEIAELQQLPPATVRSQLRRGLDLLRRALPVGICGLAAPACPPARFRAVRATVLAAAGPTAAGAAITTGSIGGLLTMKKWIVAAACLLIAGWLASLFLPAAPVAPAGIEAEVLDSSALPADARGPAAATTAAAPARTVLATATSPRRMLAGILLYTDTSAPVEGATVVVTDLDFEPDSGAQPAEGSELYHGAAPSPRRERWATTTDAAGRFAVAVDDRSLVHVEARAPDCIPQRLNHVVVRDDLRIALERSRQITVEVRHAARAGETTRPARGAACRLVFNGDDKPRRVILDAETGADGICRFPADRSSVHLIVEMPGYRTFSRIYTLAPDADAVQVVLQPPGKVYGRVVDDLGTPLRGAVLTETYRPRRRVVTDAQGGFALPHVAGNRGLWTVRLPGHGPAYLYVPDDTPAGGRLDDTRVRRVATLTGRVAGLTGAVQVRASSQLAHFGHNRWHAAARVQDGTSVTFAAVVPDEPLLLTAQDDSGQVAVLAVPALRPGSDTDFGVLVGTEPGVVEGAIGGAAGADATSTTGPAAPCVVHATVTHSDIVVQEIFRVAAGPTYRLDGLFPGRIAVRLQRGDLAGGERHAVLRPGETTTLDLTLGVVIRGQFVDQRGRGISGVRIQVGPRYQKTDASGRFTVAGMTATGSYRVQPLFSRPGTSFDPPRFDDVRPGGEPLVFVVRRNAIEFRGRVEAGILADHPHWVLRVKATGPGQRPGCGFVAEDGSFAVAVQDRGPYRLELRALARTSSATEPVASVPTLDGVVAGGPEFEFHRAR